MQHRVGLEWFFEEAIGAAPDRLMSCIFGFRARNHDHLSRRCFEPRRFNDGQTFTDVVKMRRQMQVAYDHADGFLLHKLDDFRASASFEHAIVRVERPVELSSHRIIVVYHDDGLFMGSLFGFVCFAHLGVVRRVRVWKKIWYAWKRLTGRSAARLNCAALVNGGRW